MPNKIAGVSLVCWLIFAGTAWASETDILLRKLVQKGLLTEQEAQEVKDEVRREAAAEQQAATPPLASKPHAAPETARPASEETPPRAAAQKPSETAQVLPNWVKTTQWSGDLRLRVENQRREPAADRIRERFRLRFGFVTKPWEPLEVGVRLTTGATGDPVSTNQSFGGTFDRKPVLLDKAYAKYSPWEWLSAVGGKMENPFHTVTETAWDADVTPEGAALQLKMPDNDNRITPFANFGAFRVSELASDAGDPGLFGVQGGVEAKLPAGFSWKPSISYYDWTAVQGSSTANFNNAPSGNTTVTEGAAAKFRDDFNLVVVASQVGLPPVANQPVTLFGDWTHNEGAADDDGAWAAGVEVGKVTEKLGSWKTFYLYKKVEPNASFGPLTDSDFGGGGTNHEGHRMGVQMGLNKWASLGLTYTRADELEGTQNRVDTLQADANLKF